MIKNWDVAVPTVPDNQQLSGWLWTQRRKK
ncbi:MAG: hypothetical protein ACI8RD_008538 [Bacillariaceae sp.]|jgi:hypothetical protein